MAELHEQNAQLRAERLRLQERAAGLEADVKRLSAAAPAGPKGAPTCPNCSTPAKPICLPSVPPLAADDFGATRMCSKCGYLVKL